MKKTLKRLCTGFLALATVVTALPTKIVDLDEAWAFLNVAQGETLSNKLVRAGRAMQAGVYFVILNW